MKQIVDVYRTYRPPMICVEDVAFSKWLGQELERQMRESGLSCIVEQVKRDPRLTKQDRQKKLVFPLRGGKIRVRVDEPELVSLKNELRGFPKGRYDDILDTLTDVVEYLNPPWGTQSEVAGYRKPPRTPPGNTNFQTGYRWGRAQG